MIYLVFLWLLLPALALASPQWPNEPAHLKTIYDCPFSGTWCPEQGKTENVFNTQAYASFPNAPQSPSSVFDSYMAAGSVQGNGQWVIFLDKPTELFIGTWWGTNSEFMGNQAANKMLFARTAGLDNNFLNWDIRNGGGSKNLYWYMQAEYDNCGHPGEFGMCYSKGDGTGWFQPNVGSGAVAAGSGFHRIEVYLKTSTTKTSRDGIVRWWLDGKPVGDYPTVNLTPGGLAEFQINHTWDGFNTANRDKSKAWHHYWDHLHLSASSGTPLPPPIPVAPGTVTGVTATVEP